MSQNNLSFLVIIIMLCLTTGCANLKNKDKKMITAITYEHRIKRVLPDSIYKLAEKGELKGFDVDDYKRMQNPEAEHYQLLISDSLSQLTYIDKLYTEEYGIRYFRHPFGEKSYKFKDSIGVYKDISNKINNTYVYEPIEKYKWKDGKKDSIILDTPVHLMLGKNENYNITAWVTNKIPKDFSIYKMYYPDGFVLAYEKENLKPEMPIEYEKELVYPIKIKQQKKVISSSLGKIKMSAQEYLDYNKS